MQQPDQQCQQNRHYDRLYSPVRNKNEPAIPASTPLTFEPPTDHGLPTPAKNPRRRMASFAENDEQATIKSYVINYQSLLFCTEKV
ncbi:hypothetical protein [Spirosoma jeollabukense]